MAEKCCNGRKVPLSYGLLASMIAFFVISLLAVGFGVHYGLGGRCDSGHLEDSFSSGGNLGALAAGHRSDAESTMATKTQLSRFFPRSAWLLHRDVLPMSYDLQLKPYLPPLVPDNDSKVFTFDGSVSVLLHCRVATSRLVMNMKDIRLLNDTLQLRDAAGKRLAFAATRPYEYNSSLETITFLLDERLQPNSNYTLSVEYTARLGDNNAGFYKSKYMDGDVVRWLAVTDFECCDARAALPCFDQPDFKAIFNVTIIHPRDMVALANTAMTSSVDIGNGWRKTTFMQSPKMSTYLLAFTVCAFNYTSKYTKDKVLFRIWARPSAIEHTNFAKDAGPIALDYYASYFNRSFPLEKQDMLAVPDFEAGAMENWGLVTYRETALLYNQNTSWQANKDRVAVVVAHELAHQWFGNLVTMKSWNDLWLNEGFATYFEVIGADHVLGNTTRLEEQFNVDQLQTALLLDQLNNTRPILADAVSPSEIESIFDAITYSKGGAVIRMLAYTLDMSGKPVFQKGLQHYIKKYAYESAKHTDLWASLDLVVNAEQSPLGWDNKLLNVTKMMHAWITKAGYPLVTVTRDYNSSVAVLSQRRFFLCQAETRNSSDAWYVPVWYQQKNDPHDQFVWLSADKPSTIVDLSSDDWLLVNVRQKSFCRVNYDPRNWKLIQRQLIDDYEKIHALSRAQLLDDSQNLARAGKIPYELALNLTRYLSKESNYLPWTALLPTFNHMHSMMAEKPEFVYYQAYMHRLLRPHVLKLSDSRDEFLKNVVFYQACMLAEPTCVRMALQMFAQFKVDCGRSTNGTSTCSRVPTFYRREVYCTAMAHGNNADWFLLWKLYKSEEQAVESNNLLYGLSCTTEPDLISILLSQAVKSEPTVRKQDIPIIFRHFKSNIVAKWLIWTFLVNNVDRIVENLGHDFFCIAHMIQAATWRFNTEYEVTMMKRFYDSTPAIQKYSTAFDRQLETVKSNVKWMKRYYAKISQWLKDVADSQPSPTVGDLKSVLV